MGLPLECSLLLTSFGGFLLLLCLTRYQGAVCHAEFPLPFLLNQIPVPPPGSACGTFVCAYSWQQQVFPRSGPPPSPPPAVEGAPLVRGCWQELNAGRASAQLGTEQGMQLKVLQLPGSAQLREPLRPMGNAQGSFPIRALSSHPGLPVCVLIAQRLILHSAKRAQPAGWWFPC